MDYIQIFKVIKYQKKMHHTNAVTDNVGFYY